VAYRIVWDGTSPMSEVTCMQRSQIRIARQVRRNRVSSDPVLVREECDVCAMIGVCDPEDVCPKCAIKVCPRCRHGHVYRCGRA
jgi:hypothetical protein